ncbi:multidrug effflux MFS transporter [Microlunatus soli]|uniref:multidrug effflux MFS transporter n=1 Tax=Microlunatus soli TaxID=630515 RepID=UPI001E53676F|nr:multidrug effflux MFS transporter [Microlunatus soli]
MQTSPPAFRARSRLLPVLLLVLTVFGPVSMDLYLPALPALTRQLDAATSTAQLTVTACLIGLALGQLITGPLSDRFGRSRPLYVGVIGYVVASLLCAVSPSIESLIIARLVQGIAGGAGIVIAQAAGRDIYTGNALIRFYGRLTVIGGLAAIIGPQLGGQLSRITDWRGLFVFLAALGAVIIAVIAVVYRETLPTDRRTVGGFGQIGRHFRTLLDDRRFVGAVLTQGFATAAIFGYLSGATYVLQGIYGLSPQQYALAFGLNSAGFMLFGYLAGRLVEHWSVTGTLAVGLAMAGAGALGLLACGLVALPLPVVIISLLIMVGGVAASTPPTTTIALADYPQLAGTASSLLGMARYAFGGVAAPFVGIAGAATILPLGVVTSLAILLAAIAFVTLARPNRTRSSRRIEVSGVGVG